MATTFVTQRQRLREGEWSDVSSHDDEAEARAQLNVFRTHIGDVLGPWRLVRREETEI